MRSSVFLAAPAFAAVALAQTVRFHTRLEPLTIILLPSSPLFTLRQRERNGF